MMIIVEPHGFGNWFDLFLLEAIGLFKLDRGVTMLRRSRFLDALGVSFIAQDWIMFVAYQYGVLATLYPHLATDEAVRWPVRIFVLVIVSITWLIMRRSHPNRIRRAAGESGVNVGHNSPHTGA